MVIFHSKISILPFVLSIALFIFVFFPVHVKEYDQEVLQYAENTAQGYKIDVRERGCFTVRMETSYSSPRGQAPAQAKPDVKVPVKININEKSVIYDGKRYLAQNVLSKDKDLVNAEGDLFVFCLENENNLKLIIDTGDVNDFYEVKRVYLTDKVNYTYSKIIFLIIYILFVFSFIYEAYSQKAWLRGAVCLIIVVGYTVLARLLIYGMLFVKPDSLF